MAAKAREEQELLLRRVEALEAHLAAVAAESENPPTPSTAPSKS